MNPGKIDNKDVIYIYGNTCNNNNNNNNLTKIAIV